MEWQLVHSMEYQQLPRRISCASCVVRLRLDLDRCGASAGSAARSGDGSRADASGGGVGRLRALVGA